MVSSPTSIPAGFCSQKLWGLIFLALKSWAGGPSVDLGLLAPVISQIFIHHTWVKDQLVPRRHLPTSLDGCGFFNSVVVRFPFNSITDVSEGWLFYILVVILMWLCEEVSSVCLCCHLDWKSVFCLLILIDNWVYGKK